MFQRDGSIRINGIVIKGAPSLARFNPNFRDARAPKKPTSRGLTQGNIVQVATKALAALTHDKQLTIVAGNARRKRTRRHADASRRTALRSAEPTAETAAAAKSETRS